MDIKRITCLVKKTIWTAVSVSAVILTSCSGGKSDNGSVDNAEYPVSSSDSITVATVSVNGESCKKDYVGDYTDSNDGSTLHIGKSTNAGLSIRIDLFRLTEIDDGIGNLSDGSLIFTAKDAAGNPIKGKITLDGDTATLEFTESTWEYLPNGTTYRFKRDTAAMQQEKESLVGKTFSGSGNGGGMAIDVTIVFKSGNVCECTSDFYQAFPKPVKVDGTYFIRNGIVEVICRPDGFEETPIDWYFSVKNGGEELSFNSSDANEEGSIGNNWLILHKK